MKTQNLKALADAYIAEDWASHVAIRDMRMATTTAYDIRSCVYVEEGNLYLDKPPGEDNPNQLHDFFWGIFPKVN